MNAISDRNPSGNVPITRLLSKMQYARPASLARPLAPLVEKGLVTRHDKSVSRSDTGRLLFSDGPLSERLKDEILALDQSE